MRRRPLSSSSLAFIALTTLLAACTPHVTAVGCPALRDYPPGFAARLADEIEALPPEATAIPEALEEWYALRAQARTCEDAQ